MKYILLIITIFTLTSCGTKKTVTQAVSAGSAWGKMEELRWDSIAEHVHVDIRVDYLGAPDSTGSQKVMGSKQVTIQGEREIEEFSAASTEAEGTKKEYSKSSDIVNRQQCIDIRWVIGAIMALILLSLTIIIKK